MTNLDERLNENPNKKPIWFGLSVTDLENEHKQVQPSHRLKKDEVNCIFTMIFNAYK